jgi:hypothetical protein
MNHVTHDPLFIFPPRVIWISSFLVDSLPFDKLMQLGKSINILHCLYHLSSDRFHLPPSVFPADPALVRSSIIHSFPLLNNSFVYIA